jgi:GNAT superfamily N-acetyltransferase
MSATPAEGYSIEPVTAADLLELLPLMRAYCDFYGVAPEERALLALSQTLISDPEQGVQLIARDQQRTAAGFATVFWSWSTTAASRIGIMHDLYVGPDARGQGLADRLIRACLAACTRRGASSLEWQTAPENLRAQAVYDRVGGVREAWLNYALAVPPTDAEARREREGPRGSEVD